jgi:hypothetical protein
VTRAANSVREIRLLWVAIGGGLTGTFSWLMAWMISGYFEPFDSSSGLFINQLFLTLPVMLMAWHYRARICLLFLLCAYLGMNLANYGFGSSETRAWFALGALTSLLLLLLPVAAALTLTLFRYIQRKRSDSRLSHS